MLLVDLQHLRPCETFRARFEAGHVALVRIDNLSQVFRVYGQLELESGCKLGMRVRYFLTRHFCSSTVSKSFECIFQHMFRFVVELKFIFFLE